MMLQYNLGNLQKVNNYREAFQLVGMPSQVVSFVGGGGKTTTIRRLAYEILKCSIYAAGRINRKIN